MKRFLLWWNGLSTAVYRWWSMKGRAYVLGAPIYGWIIVKATAPESIVMLTGGGFAVLGIIVLMGREPLALGLVFAGSIVALVTFWRVRWLWRARQSSD